MSLLAKGVQGFYDGFDNIPAYGAAAVAKYGDYGHAMEKMTGSPFSTDNIYLGLQWLTDFGYTTYYGIEQYMCPNEVNPSLLVPAPGATDGLTVHGMSTLFYLSYINSTFPEYCTTEAASDVEFFDLYTETDTNFIYLGEPLPGFWAPFSTLWQQIQLLNLPNFLRHFIDNASNHWGLPIYGPGKSQGIVRPY